MCVVGLMFVVELLYLSMFVVVCVVCSPPIVLVFVSCVVVFVSVVVFVCVYLFPPL